MQKAQIVIEVKDGSIIFIGSTEPVQVAILDHDWEVMSEDECVIQNYEPDRLFTAEEIKTYIENKGEE